MISTAIIDRLNRELGLEQVSTNINDLITLSRDVTPICYKWIDLYGQPPQRADAAVFPKNMEHLKSILNIANEEKIPLNIYGGGSGTVGGIIPLEGGITVDMSYFDRILGIDHQSLSVTVESGVIAQILEDYLNLRGYTFRHYPQSFRSASIGGLIATKSIGQFSTKYGGIENFLVGVEVLLANGKVISLADAPRSSTGPDIKNMFIGSEGILGIITKANLRIYKLPEKMKFQCYLYKDIYAGLDSIRDILQSGLNPPVVRLYNEQESKLKFENIGFGYQGCLLVLCYEGQAELAEVEASLSERICSRNGGKNIGDQLGKMWYEHRFDTRHIMEKDEEYGGISDAIEISASWSKIKGLYYEIEKYFKQRNIMVASHFSHAYAQGISSYNIFYVNREDEQQAIDEFYRIWDDIMQLTLNLGGSISHHHGIGMIKNKMLKKELGPGYDMIKDLKNAVDKNNILTRGKLI
ncbi:MAG: FAD-binding oxidoreductase [Actinomycetota bacterium]|nr:FAD-binding oxidoreductase [Actinomycetota bacterium]